MTLRTQMLRLFEQEDLNFLLTNRIPRRLATLFVGWFSKIEQPLVRDLSIGLWRMFSGLDLSEAKTSEFRSMHDCFTRELKDGARTVDRDPGVLVSPCDAIVGACGTIAGTDLYQVKGFPYSLREGRGISINSLSCVPIRGHAKCCSIIRRALSPRSRRSCSEAVSRCNPSRKASAESAIRAFTPF